jgi:hypothetical protein
LPAAGKEGLTMGVFKAPKQPNPYATAQAQAQMNKETAITQQELNMINQEGPDGSLTYSQTGTSANGTPTWTATTSLSPTQQAIKDAEDRFNQGALDIGNAQMGRVSDSLSQPFKLGNEEVEGRLYDLGRKRLDPRFAEESAALETDLINRGIRPGTAAYDSMKRSYGETKNDAYNQLLLSGRQQAVNEQLTERNQPLKELAQLLGMGSVDQPQFTNTPTTNLAAPDLTGLVQSNYQAKTASHNAALGGLFGLGSALIGGGSKMLGAK